MKSEATTFSRIFASWTDSLCLDRGRKLLRLFGLVPRRDATVFFYGAPGLAAMTDYMFDHTALLPQIDLAEPAAASGKSTEAAMRADAMTGYRGLVKEILGAGGGDRRLRQAHFREHPRDPDQIHVARSPTR